jgi:hypothetical protein
VYENNQEKGAREKTCEACGLKYANGISIDILKLTIDRIAAAPIPDIALDAISMIML